MQPTSDVPTQIPTPIPSAVHWAYLVGGSPDVFRDMRRHLIKAGINISGHCKMEARGDSVSIPRGTTVVLCATDASNHSASDAAREEARKRRIPCVLTPFRHWSICSLRLAEAGITARSIFESKQNDVSVRKFQTILESTRTVSAAALQREVQHPTSPFGAAIREELIEEEPALAAVMGLSKSEPPAPPPLPASPPDSAPMPAVQAKPAKPELPRQDIVPTFNGRVEVGRHLQRKPSKKAQARQDYARELIRNAKGEITNKIVRQAVAKKYSQSINHDLVNHIRVELGYKPHSHGGREADTLRPRTLRKLGLPVPESPPQTLPPEALKAPPKALAAATPAPAPSKAKRIVHRSGTRDVLALIAEVQEELRTRGIWGVMIEAGGTFTFQKEK